MTRDLLDEIKTKWNIPVTLPMSVPWGKDDVVWLVGEVERLRSENERLRAALNAVTMTYSLRGIAPPDLVECSRCHILKRRDAVCGACNQVGTEKP